MIRPSHTGFSRQLEVVCVVTVFAIYVGGTLITAAMKPMWFDEVVTYHIAGQPDLQHLWAVMATGIEQTPPVYHLVVHAVNGFLGPGALATRLPSVLGVTAAIVSTFLFLRPNTSAGAAVVGAAIPVLAASGAYAYEGRTYGLLLGLAAVAAVCWQRLNGAGSARRGVLLTGFAASLWLATSTHYYAGLLLVPFAAGQLVADRRRRSMDRPVWSVLVLAPLVLVPWIPLAEAGLPQRFWSTPDTSQLGGFYTNMLAPAAIPIVFALLAVGLIGARTITDGENRSTHVPSHELAFALTLSVLPLIGWTIAFFVTGVWTDRYAITAVLGLGILIAAGLDQTGPLTVRVVSILVLSTVLMREIRPFVLLVRPTAVPSVALVNDDHSSPIVVSSPLMYLQLWQYAAPAVRDRLTYLLPPPALQRANTGGGALKELSEFLPMHVEPFDRFVQTHPRFEVYGPPSWMTAHMLSTGVALKTVRTADDVTQWAAEVTYSPEPSSERPGAPQP